MENNTAETGKIIIDVVIPVFNEEELLEHSVNKLSKFLSSQKNFEWRIIIASNGSTDRTKEIGGRFTQIYPGIIFFHIPQRGRGRALRKAFSESCATVCVYIDADLPVDLDILPMLVSRAVKYTAITMPNRLDSHIQTERLFHRILFSKIYNLMIKILFPRTAIKDAQVGMKVIPRKILAVLLNEVRNNNFFFDTELLLLAERKGFPIIQLPADCYDKRQGKVNLFFCILEEFLGLIRMKFR